MKRTSARGPRALLASLLAPALAAVVAAGALAVAAPAYAEPGVTVTNDRGGSAADLAYRTSFTVTGRGFQAVRGGFGGIYLAFGWVRDPGGGAWKPSRGGASGSDYRYVPDSETEGNAGYLRFVAFPGSSTAGEAHAVMGADGSFEVDLAVPGPVFESLDRDGNPAEVDCREVTCGVLTFGAHGVRNPRNETFTPVEFTEVYDADPQQGGDPTGTDDGGAPVAGAGARNAEAGTAARPAARSQKPRLAVDRRTARAGHGMTFTATGFAPGEQVVAVLDDGVVSLGPMTAGTSGEVAGVLPLPTDVAGGTHVLRLTGAASGVTPRERFPIIAAETDAEPAPPAPQEQAAAVAWPASLPPSLVFVVLAGLALVAAAAWRVRRHLRARRTAPVVAS